MMHLALFTSKIHPEKRPTCNRLAIQTIHISEIRSYLKFFSTSVSVSSHSFPEINWVKHQVDHRIRIIIGHLQHWSVFPPAQWTYLEAIFDLDWFYFLSGWLIFVIFWNLLRHAIGIRWFQHPCLWSFMSFSHVLSTGSWTLLTEKNLAITWNFLVLASV